MLVAAIAADAALPLLAVYLVLSVCVLIHKHQDREIYLYMFAAWQYQQ